MPHLCTCHGYVGTCEKVDFLFVTDIQSWWEVPSIAHFCSLFRAAFNLLDFDIEVRKINLCLSFYICDKVANG